MTPLAGFAPALADLLRTRAPSLDPIGVHLHGDIVDLLRKLEAPRWDRPCVVTGWVRPVTWKAR